MQLQTQQLTIGKKGECIISQITLDEDKNLPENKGDIAEIVVSNGRVCVEQIEIRDSRVLLKGKLQFQCMYFNEQGQYECFHGSVEFEEDVQAEEGFTMENYQGSYELEDLQVSMENTRKITVQAMITIKIWKEYAKQLNYPCPNAVEGLELHEKTAEILCLKAEKKDVLELKEYINVDKSMDNINELLYQNIFLKDREVRSNSEGTKIYGTLGVWFVYAGENGGYFFKETEVPFSCPAIEKEGNDRYLLSKLYTEIGSSQLDIVPDDEGEFRRIRLQAEIKYTVLLYDEAQISFVDDMYTTGGEYMLTNTVYQAEHLLANQRVNCRKEGKVNVLPAEVLYQGGKLKLCGSDVGISIDHIKNNGKDIMVSGTIQAGLLFLYQMPSEEEMKFTQKTLQIPFTQQLDLATETNETNIQVMPVSLQIQTAEGGGGEYQVYVSMDLLAFVSETIELQMVTGYEENGFSMATQERIGGITVYYPESSERLWDIGRKFYISRDTIRKLNNLPEGMETFSPGQQLILCRESTPFSE